MSGWKPSTEEAVHGDDDATAYPGPDRAEAGAVPADTCGYEFPARHAPGPHRPRSHRAARPLPAYPRRPCRHHLRADLPAHHSAEDSCRKPVLPARPDESIV